MLFGQEVMTQLSEIASAVSLNVAGLLARPLYVCTNYRQALPAEMCMSVASMSQFVQQAPGRQHYRCAGCTASAEGVPVSDSTPLRVLHLYILVSAQDGGLTPLRMKSLRLVVEAPPNRWAWGEELGALPEPTLAQPVWSSTGKHWRYNAEESEAIWCLASSFRGEEA